MSDFVATLRTDLSDPDAELFADEVLGGCRLKGIHRLARDS